MLGVPLDADSTQVVRAYRRRARTLHPDVNSEQDAAAQFSALSAAYRVLMETAPAPAPVRAGNDQALLVEHRRHAAPAPDPIGGWPTEWESRRVAWLVAGPVRVRPLAGHVQPTRTTD
jgi:hypothetical protein